MKKKKKRKEKTSRPINRGERRRVVSSHIYWFASEEGPLIGKCDHLEYVRISRRRNIGSGYAKASTVEAWSGNQVQM